MKSISPPLVGELSGIACPQKQDVLCGRGGHTVGHPGNVQLRLLVDRYKDRYLKANKPERIQLANELVSVWRNQDPPGRFLIRSDPSQGDASLWHDIGGEAASKKVLNSLRQQIPTNDFLAAMQKQDSTMETTSSASAYASTNVADAWKMNIPTMQYIQHAQNLEHEATPTEQPQQSYEQLQSHAQLQQPQEQLQSQFLPWQANQMQYQMQQHQMQQQQPQSTLYQPQLTQSALYQPQRWQPTKTSSTSSTDDPEPQGWPPNKTRPSTTDDPGGGPSPGAYQEYEQPLQQQQQHHHHHQQQHQQPHPHHHEHDHQHPYIGGGGLSTSTSNNSLFSGGSSSDGFLPTAANLTRNVFTVDEDCDNRGHETTEEHDRPMN